MHPEPQTLGLSGSLAPFIFTVKLSLNASGQEVAGHEIAPWYLVFYRFSKGLDVDSLASRRVFEVGFTRDGPASR